MPFHVAWRVKGVRITDSMLQSARAASLAFLWLGGAIAVAATTQTIAFDPISNQILGVSPFVIAAQASSGLPVTFTSTTPGVCKTSGSLVLVLSTGPCFITASQAGNGTYSSATSTRSFIVSLAKPTGTLQPATGSPFAVGTRPFATVVGDFNGDGIPDLVVANSGGGGITVLLGNGSGGFAATAGSPISTGTNVFSNIAVGDFNGDGMQDLAFPDGNNVSVLLGNGSGGFAAARGSPFAAGSDPMWVVVGDFNGDGIQDLAAANNGSNNVTVLLGNGLGGFSMASGSPFPAGSGPFSMVTGDFNGDGVADLATVNSTSKNLTVLLGNGSGGFTASNSGPYPLGNDPTGMAMGDFNGDGIPDLAIANSGDSTITVLLGNGSGGFTAATGSPVSGAGFPSSIAIGDFNGDGMADLAIVGAPNSSIVVFLGNGAGGFNSIPNGGYFDPFSQAAPYPVPASVVAADFNGDGLMDLAAANYAMGANSVTVMLGGLTPTTSVLSTTSPATITFGQTVPLSLAVSTAGTFNSPTGTVTFSDGASVLGTASQNAGLYTFTASGLTGGRHTIAASYGGGSGNAASASNAVTIQVNPASQTISFGALSNVGLGSGTVTLTATASSGLAVSFVSTTTGVCTVAGNSVTLVSTGACSITASQAGSSNYISATPVTQSFVVGAFTISGQIGSNTTWTLADSPITVTGNIVVAAGVTLTAQAGVTFGANTAPQTISFGPLNNIYYGSAPFTISATSTSGFAVSFTSSTTNVCTMSGTTVTIVNTGTCTITATDLANGNYATATPVTQGFSVLSSSYSGQPATCSSATAHAVFVRTESTNEQVADTMISCAGGYSGSMNLTVYLSPAVNITSATVGSVSETVAGVNATATTLAAGSVHGLVSGNSVTFAGLPFPAGAFTVTISNIKINAATVVTNNGVPTGISETIFVSGSQVTPSAVTTSGAVAYVTNGLAVVQATGVTSEPVCVAATADSPGFSVQFGEGFLNAFKVQGSAAGNSLLGSWYANHTETGYGVVSGEASNTATSGTRVKMILNNIPSGVSTIYVPITVSNNGGVLTLTGSEAGVFSAVPASTASGAPAGSAALLVSGGSATAIYETTSPSSLAATFTVPVYLVANADAVAVSSTAIRATVSLAPIGAASNVPSFVNGSSTTTVTGSSFTSCASGIPQTISFGPLSNVPLSAGTVALAATASSGLPVVFASATPGVCTVSGSVASLISAGACSITAAQPGNPTYAAATPVVQTFTVTSSNTQTISFGALSNVASGTAPFAISATASSGLVVSFASTTSSVCTVAGNTVTVVGTGMCSITASQAGNSGYLAAAPVTRSFSVVVVSSQASCTASGNAVFVRAEGTTEQVADTTLSCTGGNALPMNITLYLSPSVDITSAALAGGVTEALAGLNASPTALAAGAVNGVVSANSVSFTGVPTTSGAFTLTITNIKINASTVATGSGVPTEISETLFLGGSGAVTSSFSTVPAVAYVTSGLSNVAATPVISYPVCLAITSAVPGFNVQFGEGFPNAFKVQGSAVANSTVGSWFSNHTETGYGVTVNGVSNTASSGTRVRIIFNNIPANAAVYVPVSVTNNGGTMTLTASETGAFSAVPSSNASGAPGGVSAVTVVGGTATVIYETTAVSTSSATYNVPVYLVASAGAIAVPAPGITATVSLAPIGAAGNVPGFVNGTSTATVNGSNFAPCGLSAASQVISFAPLSNTTMTAGTVALTATATSGLTVSFTSNSPGICTVAGNTATLVSAGTCSITASQAGNSNYAAAPPVTQTFVTGTTNSQTITFPPLVTMAVGTLFGVSATASSGLAVTFASATPAVCTISGISATLVATGICSITASQAGNGNYLAATPVTQSFSVVTGGPPATCSSATANAVFVRTEGTTEQVADTVINCTGGNGLPANITVYVTPAVTITSAMVGGRSEAVAGLNNTSTTFASAPVSGTVSGNSVTFTNVPTAVGAFTLTITNIKVDASQLPFSNVPSGISETIFINGSGVTPAPITTGSAVAYATNAIGLVSAGGVSSNAVCNAITATSPNFAISVAEAFADAFKIQGLAGANSTIGAWYTQHSETGYGVTSGAASNTATSGTRVKIIFGNIPAGISTLYLPISATNNSGILTLTTSETGAFSAVPPSPANGAPNNTAAIAVVAGSATVIYEATAVSTAPATYTFPVYLAAGAEVLAGQTSAITATVSLAPIGAANNVPSFVNGTSTTTVSGSTFAACGQTITFGPLSNVILGSGNVTLTGSASSGLGLSFASTTPGVCTVAGNVATPVGGGTCSITASQAGSGAYSAAAPVTETFTISVPTPAVSSVTPNTVAAYSLATAVSVAGGNLGTDSTVYFTPPGGVATAISASLISSAQMAATIPATLLTTAGTAEIFVGNRGTATLSNQVPFTITPVSQTISFDAIPNQIFGISPFEIGVQASSGLPITFTSSTPGVCKNSSGLVMLLATGTCSITANQGGNAAYGAASSFTRSFAVSQARASGTLMVSTGSPGRFADASVVAVGDFNGDGIPDLVESSYYASQVSVLLGNGSGGFTTAPGSPFTVSSAGSVVVGDFNGDGIEDLAIFAGYNAVVYGQSITVLLGSGTGSFTPAPGSPVSLPNFEVGPTVMGDFNGDGIEDIAAINYTTDKLTVLFGNGSGGFTVGSTTPVSAASLSIGLATGDFNGDGVQDLAVTNYGGSVAVLLGNGSGGFMPSAGSPFTTGTEPQTVAVDDFNGDGIQDLAVVNYGDGSVTVLLGNGSGGFAPAPGSPFAAGSGAWSLVAADFNGDGVQDLAVADLHGNGITVLLGSGSGGFTSTGLFNVGFGAETLAAADFNGDGIEDLVTVTTSGVVAVLLGGMAPANSVLSTTSSLGIPFGQSVPLSLAVSDSTTAFAGPTGTATFSDGSSVLGSATQTSSPYTFTAGSLGIGSHVLTASYGGDSRTSGSVSNSITIQVTQAPQTITFGPLTAVTLPASAFSLTATASSGLTVGFAATTPVVCSVSGTTVTPLAAGTCSITASQAGNANYLAAASVTRSFTINPVVVSSGGGGGGGGSAPGGGSALTVSPAAVTISANVGGSPASMSVTLSYQTQTQGAPSFSSNFNTNQGQGWLSVSPATGTMTQASYAGFLYTYTATVNIVGDPTGIAAGSSYTGTVNFSGGGGIVSVPVTMNISAQPARFTVAPASLSFSYQKGNSAVPATQSIAVFSLPTGAAFTATASSNGSWLSVGSGGTTPGALAVSVNVSGLAAGSYSGSIALGSLSVPVSLTVLAAAPAVLSVSPGIETLSLVQGAAATGGQVTVANIGGGTLDFSASSDQGWLTVGPGSGSVIPGSPVSLPFGVNPANLTPGVYTGHITVSDENSPAESAVTVVLTVTATATPSIQLSNTGLTLTGVTGGSPPQAQTVVVSNSGAGSLNWSTQVSTTSGGSWLVATAGTRSVSISANTNGLAAGVYYGSVNVVAANASNSPQAISVVLNLLAASVSAGVTVSTGGVLLLGSSSQTVGLYNAGSGAISYVASVFANGGSWLTVSPASGMVNAGANSISIAANLNGLTGVQQGQVTLAFGDGSSAVIQVVALGLGSGSARGGGVADLRAQTSVAACPGGKASFLIPVFSEPASASSVEVASAVTVEAQAVDDCGHAVTAAAGGSVQVSFSNGDAAINLNDVGAGVWEATWVPVKPGASVVLTAGSSENGLTTNPALSALSSVTVSVLAAAANAAPQPTGIANAASAAQAVPEVVAPGSYVAIYGTGLAGSGNPSASALPLPTMLNGTQMFLGGLPMPLLYAGPGQVNALVPQGIAPNATYPLVVMRGTAQSVPVPLTVTELQPGAYTVNTSGSGAGIVTNALTGILNSASNPAHAGDYLVVYATGLGALVGRDGQSEPSDGAAAPTNIVYSTTAQVTATIGGVNTPVLFSGLTATFAGLYQVNLQVPAGVAPGSAVPLVLTATDAASGVSAVGNAVTVVVQ